MQANTLDTSDKIINGYKNDMKQLHSVKMKKCQETISVNICYVKEFHPDFPGKTIQDPTDLSDKALCTLNMRA